MGDPGDQGKPGDRQVEKPKRNSGGGKQPGAGRPKTTLDRIPAPDVKNSDAETKREDGYMWATEALAHAEGFESPEEWVRHTWREHIDALKLQRGEYWDKIKARWQAHLQDEIDRNRLSAKKKTGGKGKLGK